MLRQRLLQVTAFCLLALNFIVSTSEGSSTDNVHGELDRRMALLRQVALKNSDGSASKDCSNRNFIFMHDRPYGETIAFKFWSSIHNDSPCLHSNFHAHIVTLSSLSKHPSRQYMQQYSLVHECSMVGDNFE